jgi:AcrR family transcriptional regulator
VSVAVSEHGYAKLSIRQVVRGAGVSSRTFYEFFSDKQAVLLAAYDAIFARLLETIETACVPAGDWPAKVRAGIAAMLAFAAAEPEAARLVGVHTFASGPEGAERVLDSRARLATLLGPGRRYGTLAARLPELTERALVDAIWMFVGSRLIQGDPEQLAELEPQLIELALFPYLGCEGAA